MSEQILNRLWKIAAVVLAASVVLVMIISGWDAAVGILIGGLWNLLSLWALSQLLNAWLGPRSSNRRVAGWLLVKFPLLYVLAFVLMRMSLVSIIGFGIGFSIVLITAMFVFAVSAMQMSTTLTRQ